MDKQNLLDSLDSKFYKVLDPAKQRDEAGISWYLVGVYDKTDEGMVRQNISFFVEDDGGDKEAAYWTGGEPKPSPTAETTFASEVRQYVVDITDASIVDCAVERINGETEVAIIQALVMVDNALVERRLVVSRDGESGELQHTQVEVAP